MKSLFIGNLPWAATEDEVKALFEGNDVTVQAVRIITDKMTGRAKGFGFVEVEDNAMEKAIALNGSKLGERELVINEARPRTEKAGAR